MSDKIIISTISKIHFIIVSVALFIFLSLSSIFMILQNGLLIDNISNSKFKIEKLYIKWEEKLNVYVDSIELYENNSKKNSSIEQFQKYFSKLKLFDNWFDLIKIDRIIYDDINGNFYYSKDTKGFLNLKADQLTLNSSIILKENLIHLYIDNFNDAKRKISINGDMILNPKQIVLDAILNVEINNDLSANVYLHANQKELSYKLHSKKSIKDIKYITNLFSLPKGIEFWARDAIKNSTFDLKELYGFVNYSNIKNAYKNIYAKGIGNNLSYTYNKNLDAIHTKQTNLEFKDGVLYIKPKHSYSYGMNLADSWLKIDFSKKQELLTLYLLFDAKLNSDTLNILKTYGIKLPFLQNSGDVKTNLTISVNLRTIGIDAKGEFFTKKGNFDYLGLNIDIEDTYIKLNNYNVVVDNMKASYKDFAKANVSFTYDAKKRYGDINFKIYEAGDIQSDFKLQKPFNVLYKIRDTKDSIELDRSFWILKDNKINIAKLSLPFDLDSLSFSIPRTLVTSNILSANLNGDIDLKSQKANLFLEPLYDDKKNIINIVYDKNITIDANKLIKYKYQNIDLTLKKAIYNKNKNTLYIKELSAEDKNKQNIFIDKKSISFDIDFNQNKMKLEDISLYLPSILESFDSKKSNDSNHSNDFNFNIETKNTNLYISKNRYIPSDKILLNIKNSNLKARLYHEDAKAELNYKNNYFTLIGHDFNDIFMEKLFNNSNFKGGKFGFSINGSPDKYNGEITLKKSTILKYVLLNNTLAFMNTIPSIATFTLPSYTKDGIFVENSYVKFNSIDKKYFINNAYLKSKELKIIGTGVIDIINNKIDMDITLKTDLGSKLSEIPLVGYIIFDKDTLSTHLNLNGNLDNPKVNSKLANDILIAPLNIIKRTLQLPLTIFEGNK